MNAITVTLDPAMSTGQWYQILAATPGIRAWELYAAMQAYAGPYFRPAVLDQLCADQDFAARCFLLGVAEQVQETGQWNTW